jgi:hypothetical protein
VDSACLQVDSVSQSQHFQFSHSLYRPLDAPQTELLIADQVAVYLVSNEGPEINRIDWTRANEGAEIRIQTRESHWLKSLCEP